MTTEPMKNAARLRAPNAASDTVPLWPNEPSPHRCDYERDLKVRHNANERAENKTTDKAARAALRQARRARIDQLKGKMLDRVDAALDRLAPQPADHVPLVLARRQIANLVGAPQFCARKLCHRRRACCGEPRHCLAAVVPLLPPATIEALALGARRTRRGRA